MPLHNVVPNFRNISVIYTYIYILWLSVLWVEEIGGP